MKYASTLVLSGVTYQSKRFGLGPWNDLEDWHAAVNWWCMVRYIAVRLWHVLTAMIIISRSDADAPREGPAERPRGGGAQASRCRESIWETHGCARPTPIMVCGSLSALSG